MMKHIMRRLLVALYGLWGILYLFIILNARQLAATITADPAFVSEMTPALAGAGAILVLVTVAPLSL